MAHRLLLINTSFVTINNDLDNKSTTIISSTRNYDKKGRLTSIINDKHKF